MSGPLRQLFEEYARFAAEQWREECDVCRFISLTSDFNDTPLPRSDPRCTCKNLAGLSLEQLDTFDKIVSDSIPIKGDYGLGWEDSIRAFEKSIVYPNELRMRPCRIDDWHEYRFEIGRDGIMVRISGRGTECKKCKLPEKICKAKHQTRDTLSMCLKHHGVVKDIRVMNAKMAFPAWSK